MRVENGEADNSTAVAQALDEIFAVGVDHGDLAWRNVLVREEGQGLRVMIIDFNKATTTKGSKKERKRRRDWMLERLFSGED